ncbi:MAG: hypothetical protein ACYTG4_08665 [Planctomycetota bacterium]
MSPARVAALLIVVLLAAYGCGEKSKSPTPAPAQESAETPPAEGAPGGSAEETTEPEAPAAPVGPATPEECNKAANEAVANEDYAAICRLTSPATRPNLIAVALLMRGFSMMGKSEEEVAKFEKEMKELFAEHGVDYAALEDDGGNDDEAFDAAFADARNLDTLFATLMEGAGGNMKANTQDALGPVTIDGDKATAESVSQKDGQEVRKPVSFIRIDGVWYIEAE